jgi:hypothetical protein
LTFHITVIHLYQFNPSKKGEDPSRVIREGLASVLVFYYPFVDRVRDVPTCKLVLECTREGILFVEADADVALEEFRDFPLSFPYWKYLLHDVSGSQNITNSPVLLIQVNSFMLRFYLL